jgi:hypothetical protein
LITNDALFIFLFQGAALGTAIFPGIGTILGGIAGGIFGGVGTSLAAGKVTEIISDKYSYDIAEGENPCMNCSQKYKFRKYLRKDNGLCDECQPDDNNNNEEGFALHDGPLVFEKAGHFIPCCQRSITI